MADRTVRYRLQAEIGQFKAQMAQAGAATKKAAADMTSMEKSAVRSRQGLDTLGSTAGKIGLVAAAGLGAAVVKAADFDAAMSQVQAATGESAASMDKLRQAALDAGAETAFSATEAADGITELAKAGVSTNDILNGGLMGSLDLAAAGQIEVGEAAEYAAKAMSQFSLSGDQVPHVADLLAAAAGKAVGEVGDFGQALNQVGLVASQTGLSIEDTVGTLAAFSQAGLGGSDAGTAFKSMLQRLQNPLGKGAEAMEQFGINAYDAQGNFVGITNVAGQLQTAFAGVDQATRDAAFAQIFGSDAVRAASVLYKEGASGIQDWINQTNDSGFAAEQAATKLDNLKGDLEALGGALETALIGTGSGSQGMLRNLTQGLTGVINKYNELPASAQNATAAVLGGTALLGGSIWVGSKLVQGIANTREALDQLGISSEKVSGSMAKVGKVAGIAAAGLAALSAVDAAQKQFQGLDEGVEGVTERLIKLTSADLSSLGGEFDNLGESFARLADPNKAQAFQDSIYDTFGFLGSDSRVDEAVAQFEAIDAALTNVVSSGSPEQAKAMFSALADELGATGAKQEQLLKFLPSYSDALTGVQNDASLASGAQGDLAGATNQAATAAQRQAAAAADQAKALAEARKDARATANSFVDLGSAIKGGKQSLGSFLNSLEKQAAQLRDFRINAQKAAKNGLDEGLIESLRKLGPEGARQMAQLAGATKSQINRANAAWRSGQEQVRRYTNEVGDIPNAKTTTLNVNTGSALSALGRLDQEIDWVSRPREARITITRHYASSGRNTLGGLQEANGGIVQAYADGGITSGGALVQRVPQIRSGGGAVLWNEPETGWEAYISGKPGMEARNQEVWAEAGRRLGLLRFAEGGMVGVSPNGSGSVSVKAPNVNVGDTNVGVYVDGEQFRTMIRAEIRANARHLERQNDRD